jgi:hypothetical protein
MTDTVVEEEIAIEIAEIEASVRHFKRWHVLNK